MSETRSFDAVGIEESKSRIRQYVADVAALARQDLTPDEYCDQLLSRTVRALAAVGGAVWWMRETGEPVLGAHVQLEASSIHAAGEDQERHGQLLRHVAQRGGPALIAPHTRFHNEGAGNQTDGANPTELLLVIAPVKVADNVEALIEIFQRPTADAQLSRGYVTFLTKMADLAAQWLTACRLRQFLARETAWSQAKVFSRAVHESLDLGATALALANESRRWVGCDRVSIAVCRGRRCAIEAISGQDSVNQRANIVQYLRRLVQVVTDFGEPVWHPDERAAMPPELERALDQYLDESHTKAVAVIPLRRPQPPNVTAPHGPSVADRRDDVIGAVIIEQIEDLRPPSELAPQVEAVAAHAERALANSLDYSNLFLLPVWRWLGQVRTLVTARALPRTAAVLGGLALIVAILIFYPANFELAGRGALQPTVQRDIFADTDGVVAEVLVQHGARVEMGQPLVRLTNTELEIRLAEVLGQKQSTQERIAAFERARHEASLAPEEKNRLAGEILQHEQLLSGLARQLELIKLKLSRLTLTSPISGQVTTWNVEQKLLHRPVQSGQLLLSIADPDCPWELEVFMPEHRMGHVTQAWNASPRALPVEYILATDSTRRLAGRVREIHAAADLNDEHGHSVAVTVDVERSDLRDPRPGAAADARIHCGRRSLGYVWLHDIAEFIESRVLFHLF